MTLVMVVHFHITRLIALATPSTASTMGTLDWTGSRRKKCFNTLTSIPTCSRRFRAKPRPTFVDAELAVDRMASMWVATEDLPRSAAHPFYARLNQILDQHDFDGFVERLCDRFYTEEGRPGLPPGRYFRP